MKGWLYLAGAIVVEVIAALSLKAAVGDPVWYFVVTPGYALAFLWLSRALREGMPLGVAYGIWGAAGVAATAGASAIIFDEPLTLTMVLGIVIIVAGVLCVELGSQQARRREAAP